MADQKADELSARVNSSMNSFKEVLYADKHYSAIFNATPREVKRNIKDLAKLKNVEDEFFGEIRRIYNEVAKGSPGYTSEDMSRHWSPTFIHFKFCTDVVVNCNEVRMANQTRMEEAFFAGYSDLLEGKDQNIHEKKNI